MNSYGINLKKKKKALKRLQKNNLASAKWFVKLCYGATWFFRVVAILCGLGNLTAAVVMADPYLLILLIISFGFPYLFSFLPQTVYVVSCRGEYSFRNKEKITTHGDGFIYSYHDDRSNILTERFSLDVTYKDIERIEYSEKTKVLEIYGTFDGARYCGGQLAEKDVWGRVAFLNIYNIDIAAMVKQRITGVNNNDKCN